MLGSREAVAVERSKVEEDSIWELVSLDSLNTEIKINEKES